MTKNVKFMSIPVRHQNRVLYLYGEARLYCHHDQLFDEDRSVKLRHQAVDVGTFLQVAHGQWD